MFSAAMAQEGVLSRKGVVAFRALVPEITQVGFHVAVESRCANKRFVARRARVGFDVFVDPDVGVQRTFVGKSLFAKMA